jgi:hypothetical protein
VRAALPPILVAALAQGCALYGLHRAIQVHAWPATALPWLIGLYNVAVLLPTTLQLLAEQIARPALWVLSALLAAALFYFGWHHGAAVAEPRIVEFAATGNYFALGLEVTVWWLLVLPFLQGRLSTGRWTLDYRLMFQHAWRNKILLAEAALFTGLFWLILLLWQLLFGMLGFEFFRRLFSEPAFIYPVTAVVFGCALYLIGSIDRLVSVALEQILNVLKWLAVVAGVLLTLFTIALLLKLPSLLSTGQRVISATWLLWLVAVVVLLLNAAYRDGAVERPYPKWIAQALRFSLPLTVIVAAVAFYALVVRAQRYGLTVERVWAFLVAGAAVMYSVGYSIAALRKGPWLAHMAWVNVAVALVLTAAISAALTPLLSPHRLAANSQFRLVLQGRYPSTTSTAYGRISPLKYLRFYSGFYGVQRLRQLASLRDHPDAEQIRELAAKVLSQKQLFEISPVDPAKLVAGLALYPRGRTLDPELARTLAARSNSFTFPDTADRLAGVFADLDGDGVEEFVLLMPGFGQAYQNRAGHWVYLGRVQREGYAPIAWEAVRADLLKGDIAAVPSKWRDLVIGQQRLRLDVVESAQ